MRAIHKTDSLWGEDALAAARTPDIVRHCNVLYMPYGDEHCGLYDASGRIIESSVDGQRFSKPYNSDAKILQKNAPAKNLSSGDYLYIGSLNPHYGHFLINSMARLWPLLADRKYRKMKLLCHASSTRAAWEQVKFVTIILHGLGIEWDDIVFLSEPTLIHEVLVPDQALVEQTLVHPIYGEMGQSIGKSFWGDINSRSEPLYISKTKLKSGVGHMRDEELIEAEALKQGFRIIYPETLSFAEQIRTLSEHSTVAGTLGSGFHTLLFAPHGKNLFCLAPMREINSNYMLVDRVTGATASYFAPNHIDYEHGGDFITTCIVKNMEKVAVEFIEAVKARSN